MNLPLILTPGNIVAEDPAPLRLLEEHIARHVFIGGGSGSGKSKLIELLCRQFITHDCGFTYIDPHGDGVNALLQFLAVNEVDPARILHLKPGTDCCFSFDPYADPPSQDEELDYDGWLSSTTDRMIRAFLRNISLADQEVMKRLRNWLSIILYAAGVEVDGRHLGLADALILTNPDRKEFGPIFDRVINQLHPDYAAELWKLREERSSTIRDKWMESTVNMLREILKGPVVRLMFAQQAQSLSLREAVRDKKIVLVDLSETDALSRDQGNIIGGMLINFLLATVRRVPEADRVPHYLIVDEAENYIGEDLRMAFAELRKFKLSVCLAVQDLSCLRKGELDLVGKVLSQCGLQMTFQQGNPEDIEELAKAFGYGGLDFTPLLTEQVMPDGYEWVTTMSVSYGENETVSQSTSKTSTHSTTHQRHTSRSIQESVSEALSESYSEGESSAHTDSRTKGVSGGTAYGKGRAQTEGDTYSTMNTETEQEAETSNEMHGKSKAKSKPKWGEEGEERDVETEQQSGGNARMRGKGSSRGTGEAHQRSATASESFTANKGWNRGRGSSKTTGKNSSRAQGRAKTKGFARGSGEGSSSGKSVGKSVGKTKGSAKGKSSSVSFTETPLAKHKVVVRETGKLLRSVADQLAEIMKTLASLPDRFMLVKCKGKDVPLFAVQVHTVKDPYARLGFIPGPKLREDDRKRLLEKIRAAHRCYFVPKKDDQAARIARFLGGSAYPAQPGRNGHTNGYHSGANGHAHGKPQASVQDDDDSPV